MYKAVIAGQLRLMLAGLGLVLIYRGSIISGILMYTLVSWWSWRHKIAQSRIIEDMGRLTELVLDQVKQGLIK